MVDDRNENIEVAREEMIRAWHDDDREALRARPVHDAGNRYNVIGFSMDDKCVSRDRGRIVLPLCLHGPKRHSSKDCALKWRAACDYGRRDACLWKRSE